tara:strand:- start:42153 stop:42542 length:390 start_codon:yes stop_codon:yes gene_type:complete
MRFETQGDWETLTIRLGDDDERLTNHHADVVVACVKQRIKSTGIKIEDYSISLNAVGYLGGEWDSIRWSLGRNKFWEMLRAFLCQARTFRYNDGRLGMPQLRWHVSQYGWLTMHFSTKSDTSNVKEEEE